MQNPNCKQMLIQNVPLKIIYKILVYNIIPAESTITTLIQFLKYYNQNQPSVTFVGVFHCSSLLRNIKKHQKSVIVVFSVKKHKNIIS